LAGDRDLSGFGVFWESLHRSGKSEEVRGATEKITHGEERTDTAVELVTIIFV
jgi:hypothetical protein